jgi:hypothetical protein
MGRIKQAELCHPVREEGLGLWDTAKKAKALLKRRGLGWRPLSYWLQSRLGDTSTLHREGTISLVELPKLQAEMKRTLKKTEKRETEAAVLQLTVKSNYNILGKNLLLPRLVGSIGSMVAERVFGCLPPRCSVSLCVMSCLSW